MVFLIGYLQYPADYDRWICKVKRGIRSKVEKMYGWFDIGRWKKFSHEWNA